MLHFSLFALLATLLFVSATDVKVSIQGFAYCLSDPDTNDAQIHVYNVGYFGYESHVGTTTIDEDGFYELNTTVDTWHEFQARLEFDHTCGVWSASEYERAGHAKLPPKSLSVDIEAGLSEFLLAPVMLDATKPSESLINAFFKEHPELKKVEFIYGYRAEQAPWYSPKSILKRLGIH